MNTPPLLPQPLVLASSSVYRNDLLKRLGVPFQIFIPNVNEAALVGEGAPRTAWRLSQAKARAAVSTHPDALIIGSDQVATLGTQQLGKPLTHENAKRQLQAMSGQIVAFYTALTLLNARSNTILTEIAENQVHFRKLSSHDIESYLHREQPYHCAGSAKFESLGIVLIERVQGDDPNALIGLPLIVLVNMLNKMGVQLL
ncbi:MAG: Maf family nucleotide pyrophosphatase [Candidatus Nitrotoga sp.]